MKILMTDKIGNYSFSIFSSYLKFRQHSQSKISAVFLFFSFFFNSSLLKKKSGSIPFYKKDLNNTVPQKGNDQRKHFLPPKRLIRLHANIPMSSPGVSFILKVFLQWSSVDHEVSATECLFTCHWHHLKNTFKCSRKRNENPNQANLNP